MKITVSGIVGSGKSTISKILAKRLRIEYHSVGKIMRKMALDKKIPLIELSKISEKTDSIDKELDELQIEIGKTSDNFVMDSRLGFYFIPDSYKIFLDVDIETAVKRIHSDKRHDEAYESIEKAKEDIIQRINSEKLRYKKYYGIDFPHGCKFDLIIDTNNKSIEEIVEEILNAIKISQN